MVNLLFICNIVGCLAHVRIGGVVLDNKDGIYKIERYNVDKKCPCLGAAAVMCLNGGICIAGAPPWCICPAAWTGPFCGIKPGVPVIAGMFFDYFKKFREFN